MSQFYAKYPLSGGSGGGVPTYANFASFPVTAADGSLAIALDTYDLYVFDAGTMMWEVIATPGGGSGVISIGTIDTNSASSNGASIGGSALYMQSASVSDPGLVNLTTQSFAGQKTFTGTISASNLSGTNSGDLTLGTANGLSLSSQILSLAQFTSTTPGAVPLSGGGTTTYLRADGTWDTPAGAGTVTSVSVVSANGFAGSVATATSTPAITLSTSVTGLLKGNGTAISAATPGTDYVIPSGSITGTAANITATSNSTLTTLSSLSLPTSQLSGSVSLTTQVSGTLPIANGGTGQTTAANAINALLPSQTGNSGLFLTTNGTVASWAAGGSGNGFNYLSSSTSVYGGTNSTLSFTGADNTVVGVGSGAGLTSGAGNTLYGFAAGTGNTSGTGITTASANILIGYQADIVQASTHNTTVIGYNAQGDAYDVVIGSNATSIGSTGNAIAIGYMANASQGDSIAIGMNSETTAQYGIAIGRSAEVDGNGGIALGSFVNVANPNSICIAASNAGSQTQLDSASNQLCIGSPNGSGQISAIYLGKGAVAVATVQNVSIQPTPASGSNIAGANLTITAGNGTGTGGSGAINFQTAPVGTTGSTANTLATVLSVNSNQSVSINGAQTTITGSAGTAVCSMPFQGTSYKKAIIYLNAATLVSQAYTFPVAFTQTPYVYGLSAGVSGSTVSTTSITFTTTTLSGFVFVEGY